MVLVVFKRAYMKEQLRLLNPQDTAQTSRSLIQEQIRRQKVLIVAASFAALMSSGGIHLDPPHLEERPFNIAQDVTSEANLLVDYRAFFVPNRRLEIVHRGGNSIEAIDKAFLIKGANIFDIDANDHDGKIYGEHGIILDIGGDNHLVFDPTEGRLTTVTPATLEELIKHVHSLSTPRNPLGVQIELKHGAFKEKTLKELIDILYKYNMPSIIIPNGRQKELHKILNERRNTADSIKITTAKTLQS